MDTVSNAIEFVRSKGFAYWKLKKGAARAAMFEHDDNPEGDPQAAVIAFEKEIASRSPGRYEVEVYKTPNGEKGKSFFDFVKESPGTFDAPKSMNSLEMYESAKAAAKQEMRLEQIAADIREIKEQNQAIMKAISLFTDDDKGNDAMIQTLLKPFISAFANRVIPGSGSTPTPKPTTSIFD